MKKLILVFFAAALISLSCKSDNKTAVSDGANEVVSTTKQIVSSTATKLSSKEQESNSNAESTGLELDKKLKAKDIKEKLLSNKESNPQIAEVAKVEDRNETKLEVKSEEQIKLEAKRKAEATERKLKKSVNKGKSCEDMLKEQTKILDEFESTKNRKLIIKLANAQNDPFFQECMEVQSFQDKVDALSDRLEKLIEQE